MEQLPYSTLVPGEVALKVSWFASKEAYKGLSSSSRVKLQGATGGVQIIGRNLRFVGYFVTKTKKNTEKIPEDSRLTLALSDSILFVSKV